MKIHRKKSPFLFMVAAGFLVLISPAAIFANEEISPRTLTKDATLWLRYPRVVVRAAPSTRSAKLALIEDRGTVVYNGRASSATEVIEVRGKSIRQNWYQIQFPGPPPVTGWVFGGLLMRPPVLRLLIPGDYHGGCVGDQPLTGWKAVHGQIHAGANYSNAHP